jgi:molybdenum cofactor cytidylyltransferase
MAAGFSKRFGKQNKLLAPFRGKPLARHTLDLTCAIGSFEEIFFVYADEDVAALAAGLPVTLVFNPDPEKGQGESARLGVAAAAASTTKASDDAEAEYYLFLTCDQPLLDADTVRLLLEAARPGCIVEPGSHHSPSLFSAVFRNDLLALKPGELPRLIKSRHPHSVITVETINPLLLADVDTQEDLLLTFC